MKIAVPPSAGTTGAGDRRSRGELLRAWREDVVGWSEQRLAVAVGVTASALSQWETGKRRISWGQIDALAGAANTAPFIVRLLRRWGTPDALDPSSRWEFNPSAEATCTTGWLRLPRPGPARVQVRWGILSADFEVDVGADGVLLTGPRGVPNPRLAVDLDPPGWVDLFTTAPPPGLGIPCTAVLPHMLPAEKGSPFATLWARHTAKLIRGHEAFITSRVGRNFLRRLLRHRQGPLAMISEARPAHQEADNLEDLANRLRRAREAYGLSQSDLAARVTSLTNVEVSQDAISRTERGRSGRWNLLPSAIDAVLETDGRVAAVAFRTVVGGAGDIIFPEWWSGPIWLETRNAATITMIWGPYTKAVRVGDSGGVLYTRCADGSLPLRVLVEPASVRVDVGLGRRVGSTDVNDGWLPTSSKDLNDLLRAGERIARQVFLSRD